MPHHALVPRYRAPEELLRQRTLACAHGWAAEALTRRTSASSKSPAPARPVPRRSACSGRDSAAHTARTRAVTPLSRHHRGVTCTRCRGRAVRRRGRSGEHVKRHPRFLRRACACASLCVAARRVRTHASGSTRTSPSDCTPRADHAACSVGLKATPAAARAPAAAISRSTTPRRARVAACAAAAAAARRAVARRRESDAARDPVLARGPPRASDAARAPSTDDPAIADDAPSRDAGVLASAASLSSMTLRDRRRVIKGVTGGSDVCEDAGASPPPPSTPIRARRTSPAWSGDT